MRLLEKIEITKDEYKPILIIIILVFIMFWFAPRLINWLDGEGFHAPERPIQYQSDPDYNPWEDIRG